MRHQPQPPQPPTNLRPSDLQPEAQLLLCCTKPDPDAATVERIRNLLERGLDSDYLLQLARGHAMVQLLYRNLQAACPEAVSAQLRSEHQINALRGHFLAREALRLVSLLQTHTIPAIPYKGPALASAVYGDVTLRQSSDLDVLVRSRDVRRTIELLLREGYRTQGQWSPQQKEFLLHHKGEFNFVSRNSILTEVHWEFVEPYLAVPLDYRQLWQRVTKTSLCGQEVLSLCPEDLLLALCIHGTKHTWRQLNWICDIAALIQSHPQLNWLGLLRLSEQTGTRRMLLIGLAVADSLVGLELPRQVRQRIRADHAARTLAHQTCRWLFQEPRPEINVVLYHIQAKERLRDQLYYYYRFHVQRPWGLKVGLTPAYFTGEDWATVPASLLFLCRHHPPLRYCFRR